MSLDRGRSGSACRLVHGFGLRTGVQDNVLCVDETTAIFPVGRVLAQLNIETQVMSFVSEGERAPDLVLALALAPSRRFARVPFQLVVKPVPLPSTACLVPHAGIWQCVNALSTHRFQFSMCSRSGDTRPSLAPRCNLRSS